MRQDQDKQYGNSVEWFWKPKKDKNLQIGNIENLHFVCC